MKRKIFKVLPLLIALLGILAGCGGSGYKTEAKWSLASNYCFGVETPNYDGDIFKAGTYDFTTEANAHDPQDTPIVWDIYVSTNLYNYSSQLTQDEYKATVGGYDCNSAVIDLKAGDYVYINSADIVGNPTGILTIKRE